jgi:thiol:disulfide interchange protein DsbA
MTTITRAFARLPLFAAAVALLFISAAPASHAQGAAVPSKWQQGRHYRSVVPQLPTTVAPGKVEVIEIFWYGCGACYMLDPYLESWK